MAQSVLDLEKQLPDILRALKRKKKVVVSYEGKNIAVMAPLPDNSEEMEKLRSDPSCGIWKDRDDMADPAAYVRNLRKGRGHAL